MQFEINLTPNDYLTFQKFTQKRLRDGRYKLLELSSLILVAVLVFTSQFPVPAALIYLVLIGIIGPLHRYWHQQKYTRGLDYIFGKRMIEVSENQIHSIRDNYEETMQWSWFVSVETVPDYTYLMISPLAGYIIPQRSFTSMQQCEEFIQFAQNHIRQSGS